MINDYHGVLDSNFKLCAFVVNGLIKGERFEFKSGTVLFCFSFILVSFRESHLLVSWCAGGRSGMACSDEDHGKSRRPGAEDRGWSHISGTRWPGG
jgi:hypothetical protein